MKASDSSELRKLYGRVHYSWMLVSTPLIRKNEAKPRKPDKMLPTVHSNIRPRELPSLQFHGVMSAILPYSQK